MHGNGIDIETMILKTSSKSFSVPLLMRCKRGYVGDITSTSLSTSTEAKPSIDADKESF
jgi:hypothetical protein